MNLNTFIFIGRSGCGKGTQADLLVEYLKKKDKKRSIFRLETGDRFRAFIQDNTYSSKIAKEIYTAGGLMPEFLSIAIWANSFMEKLKEDQHMILDGSPRKLHEAYVLDSAMKYYHRPKVHVIYLNVNEEAVTKRLIARKRLDDNVEDIKNRMKWFRTDVMPTLEFYRMNPDYIYHDINGDQSIEEVYEEIIDRVFK